MQREDFEGDGGGNSAASQSCRCRLLDCFPAACRAAMARASAEPYPCQLCFHTKRCSYVRHAAVECIICYDFSWLVCAVCHLCFAAACAT